MGFLNKLFKKQPKHDETITKEVPKTEIKHKEVPIKRITQKGMELKKELPEVDKLANRESQLHNKMWNEEGYYGSEISKEEFREFNKDVDNYLENHPEDFITRGARYSKVMLEYIFRASEGEVNIFELMGKGLHYEDDLEQYDKAIEIYKEVDKLNKIVMKDEIADLVKHCGDGDYLYSAKAKDRIRICNNKIQRSKIKKLEAEANELETTNPNEAIKKYEELNEINPGLKKYNKRIYKMKELEAKNLEETDPSEAIRKYEELNILNPGLKKYDKRIQIVKKKLK